MKRRITLYLAGRAVDLADDGLVLLNIEQGDLTNPAVLRNSWTHDVELPATATNNRILGHSLRVDRNAGPGGGPGIALNASRRIDFAIYDDTGVVLHSGYAKLTAITPGGYKCTLYGGLGSFLYGLAYDENGSKRSLASLDYGATLDFTINAATVAEAWARLDGDTSKPAKWDVINFAPCYNGLPEDFTPDRAVFTPATCGLPTQQTDEGGTTYDAANTSGYAVFNLSEKLDEWAVKDLRSYLQRPVLSVRKLLAAIADPSNNGGWSVDLSDLADITELDSWLTRPLLPSLGTYRQSTGGISIAPHGSGTYTTSTQVGGFDINLGSTPAGTTITARLSVRPAFAVAAAASAGRGRLTPLGYTGYGTYMQVLFLQAIGYTSGNVKVAASPVLATYPMTGSIAIAELVSKCGFTPDALNTDYEAPVEEEFYNRITGTNNYQRAKALTLAIEGTDIARIEIVQKAYLVSWTGGSSGGSSPYAAFYSDDWESQYTPTGATYLDAGGTATAQTAATLRSGALVTQAMLLSTDKTPADYLLALVKMFGLYVVCDAPAKAVTILRRESFFNNTTPIDLTERVHTDSVEVQPCSFDAKWYAWKQESVGGRFEKEYKRTEGVQYGIKRVDTGYDFDSAEKDVLAGSALRSAAAVMDRGKYWFKMEVGGDLVPVVLLGDGNSYTLRSADGKTLDTPVPIPASATITSYNAVHDGCDYADRAEFRDAENKAVDGADVLLLHQYRTTVVGFNLTDDLPIMDTLVGGPCWLLGTNDDGLSIPNFSRYTIWHPLGGTPYVGDSLDFGVPRELDIPDTSYGNRNTLYAKYWADYITDRLSAHGKVLRCKCDLSGLQVGPGLLRRFYWYGGSVWVLNAIRNYSLTTFDPAECEFVQVRDIRAYAGY